jgi:hypothetical protein
LPRLDRNWADLLQPRSQDHGEGRTPAGTDRFTTPRDSDGRGGPADPRCGRRTRYRGDQRGRSSACCWLPYGCGPDGPAPKNRPPTIHAVIASTLITNTLVRGIRSGGRSGRSGGNRSPSPEVHALDSGCLIQGWTAGRDQENHCKASDPIPTSIPALSRPRPLVDPVGADPHD